MLGPRAGAHWTHALRRPRVLVRHKSRIINNTSVAVGYKGHGIDNTTWWVIRDPGINNTQGIWYAIRLVFIVELTRLAHTILGCADNLKLIVRILPLRHRTVGIVLLSIYGAQSSPVGLLL